MSFVPPDGHTFDGAEFRPGGEQFIVTTSDGGIAMWDRATDTRLDVARPTSPLRLAGLDPNGTLAVA